MHETVDTEYIPDWYVGECQDSLIIKKYEENGRKSNESGNDAGVQELR